MNLFKQAHILAKANVEKVGDYRVAFVWAIGELKEKQLLVLTPVQSFKKLLCTPMFYLMMVLLIAVIGCSFISPIAYLLSSVVVIVLSFTGKFDNLLTHYVLKPRFVNSIFGNYTD